MPTISPTRVACVRCGYDLTGAAIGGICAECGTPVEASLRKFASPATSGLAVASMVVGIIGLPFALACGLVFFPLPALAVVLGHVALVRIGGDPARLRGSGLAVTGLVTGYLGLSLVAVVVLMMVLTALASA